MDELLEIFDLNGNSLGIEKRSKYYADIKEEFAKTGKVSKKCKQVRVILMNSKGGIYIQKRSKIKQENPELYDKTIGGHVYKGHTFELTAIKECAEELGIPVTILNEKEFEEAIENTDLNVIGILKKIDQIDNFESKRKFKDAKEMKQIVISSFFLEYYDGALRFSDGESSGIELFSLEDLEKEVKKKPEKFTEDLKWMIKKYGKYLKSISKNS